MLKNLRVAFGINYFVVAISFLPCFCNSAFAQRPDTICSMNTKSSQVANFKVLTAQKSYRALDATLNLADSTEPYNPPDNGGPKRSQGSGTRNTQ